MRAGQDVWSLEFGEANSVAVDVLQRLWRTPAVSVAPIRTLADTVDDWNSTYSATRGDYPPSLVSEAVQVGSQLAASTSQYVVVHGDFNPFNVLRAKREPWLAIDPKPLVGDPAYDLAQYLANYFDAAVESGDPKRFYRDAIAFFAHELGLDPHRIAAWAFVKIANHQA
jgi:streptomycin 6-kinase